MQRGQGSRDNTAFVRRCVDAHYRKAKSALRRYDTNHLFHGDRINGNTDTLDTTLDITTRYADVIFYQVYARYNEQREILDRKADKQHAGVMTLTGEFYPEMAEALQDLSAKMYGTAPQGS